MHCERMSKTNGMNQPHFQGFLTSAPRSDGKIGDWVRISSIFGNKKGRYEICLTLMKYQGKYLQKLFTIQ